MPDSAALGGLYLLIFFVIVVVLCGLFMRFVASGMQRANRRMRDKAIRQDILDSYLDEKVAQEYARKLLKDYEGKS